MYTHAVIASIAKQTLNSTLLKRHVLKLQFRVIMISCFAVCMRNDGKGFSVPTVSYITPISHTLQLFSRVCIVWVSTTWNGALLFLYFLRY